MYESPITKIYEDIAHQLAKQEDENYMYTINQTVGYSVDKEELIKALRYDRQQYEKGYEDAMSVIEDIRAEIDKKYDEIPFNYNYYNDGMIDALEWVLELIDKRTSGAGEGEE